MRAHSNVTLGIPGLPPFQKQERWRPNNSQNAPVLTAGAGAAFITATATDPNGNTSEFSNAVASSGSGSVLDLLGNFNSLPNTNYTIEFFSSTVADLSGYGQGETYLGSTAVTTGSTCTVAVNNPVDATQADLSVTLSSAVLDPADGPGCRNELLRLDGA
jgi:hypothetical protein